MGKKRNPYDITVEVCARLSYIDAPLKHVHLLDISKASSGLSYVYLYNQVWQRENLGTHPMVVYTDNRRAGIRITAEEALVTLGATLTQARTMLYLAGTSGGNVLSNNLSTILAYEYENKQDRRATYGMGEYLSEFTYLNPLLDFVRDTDRKKVIGFKDHKTRQKVTLLEALTLLGATIINPKAKDGSVVIWHHNLLHIVNLP